MFRLFYFHSLYCTLTRSLDCNGSLFILGRSRVTDNGCNSSLWPVYFIGHIYSRAESREGVKTKPEDSVKKLSNNCSNWKIFHRKCIGIELMQVNWMCCILWKGFCYFQLTSILNQLFTRISDPNYFRQPNSMFIQWLDVIHSKSFSFGTK